MFDPKNVKCPHCKKTKLRVIESNGQILAYICSFGCAYTPDYLIDFKRKRVYHLVKRRNPDYLPQLDSDDIFEDDIEVISKHLKRVEELDRAGVPFYINTYVIGYDKFDEN